MKGLTLKAHWAAAIATLGKDCENRTWPPPPSVRGHRIAIHAGALDAGRIRSSDASDFIAYCDSIGVDPFVAINPAGWRMRDERHRSAIVATAVISGWWRQSLGAPIVYWDCTEGVVANPARLAGFIKPSRWWMPGHYGWHLTDIRVIEPIPCKGKQGLWGVPADIAGMINGSA